MEVYNMLSGIYDGDMSNILSLKSDCTSRSGNRGNSKKLYHRQWNKRVRGNFFSIRVAGVWISLPDLVICAPSLNSFKNRLDKFWRLEPIRYAHRALAPAFHNPRYMDLTIGA